MMIHSDNETKVDLLNSEPIAKTIVAVLRERPDQPVTIGVHGDWGAGKSSVLEMVEAELSCEEKILCLKFNGWRFQGFEDAKIALIEGVVTGLLEKRSWLTKADETVRSVFHQIDRLKFAKRFAGLGTAAVGFFTHHHQLGMMGMLTALESTLTSPETLTKENVGKIVEDAKGVFKEKEKHGNVPEDIAEFRKSFDALLKKAGIDQLIVLVDDLDRCLPGTAIETLEAIRLFIFTSKTAFVVAADEAMIEYSVRKHFPDLPDTTGPQSYSRNYLEKLIQVPFRIPALGQSETRNYVTLLLVGVELPDDDPAFDDLIKATRKQMLRPWLGGVLDATAIAAALRNPDKEKIALRALTISEQVGPILASGSRGNPRQIKRFLNSLHLRLASAEARGFIDDVKLPALAKLMLAERFLPTFFDQVAMNAVAQPDGRCPDLAELEDYAKQEPNVSKTSFAAASQKTAAKPVRAGDDTSLRLNEWKSSDAVLEWARVDPSLKTVDLRPYLFVAKDRKDYFGAATSMGRIDAIADKLMGTKLVVQAELAGLQRLASTEAVQVFELITARIVASDSFLKQPEGAAGLEVLVSAQPSLQPNLVTFLGRLPANRLGPWACTGWTAVLKDPEVEKRYQQLVTGWSQEGNASLKATATTVLRTPGKKGR